MKLAQRALAKRAASLIFCASAFLGTPSIGHAADQAKSVNEIQVSFKDEKVVMKNLLGKEATLIVNFGGQCDLPADGDPQCGALGELYKKYQSKGFQLLLFPTEQFRDVSMMGESEPVSEVREDLGKKFGWTFPIMDYVDVNGGNAAEIYKTMKDTKGISTSDLKKIDWNFEKFLLDKDGVPIRRYRPSIMPEKVGVDVDSLINKGVLPKRVKAALGAV